MTIASGTAESTDRSRGADQWVNSDVWRPGATRCPFAALTVAADHLIRTCDFAYDGLAGVGLDTPALHLPPPGLRADRVETS